MFSRLGMTRPIVITCAVPGLCVVTTLGSSECAVLSYCSYMYGLTNVCVVSFACVSSVSFA